MESRYRLGKFEELSKFQTVV